MDMEEPPGREHPHAQTHTQIPTDTHAGTGLGRELLILHKAGPLRGAPRHRGPLLTKPPAGSKSDPPSRLQRGQGTRLPCPPPPPRSAPMLRSERGPGCPAAARRVNLLLPRGCIGPPAPGRAATPWGPRRPKTQPARARCTAADAAACVPSAGAWPDGCQARRALDSAAWSLRPFVPQCRGPRCPGWPGPCPRRARPTDPGRVPPPPKVAYPSDQSGFLRAAQRTSSRAFSPRPWSHHSLPMALTPNPVRPGSRPLPPPVPAIPFSHLIIL